IIEVRGGVPQLHTEMYGRSSLTSALSLRADQRMTRGRSGSLVLLRMASSSMTSRRFVPAHLQLRTQNSRMFWCAAAQGASVVTVPGHVCCSKLLIFAISCKNLSDAFLDTTGKRPDPLGDDEREADQHD